MNSLTAQLRSDHGKLISPVVVVLCLLRDNFVTFRDRFETTKYVTMRNSINGFSELV